VLSGYLITVLITIGIYIILALSLNLITGYAGQVSLGHAAFMGIGAYTSALLYTKAGLSFWPSFVLAGLVTGLVGAVLAIPCLRVREDFLAITTMGINFVIEALFLYIPFFGAGMGIGGINPPSLFGKELSKTGFLVLVLLVIVLTVAADRWQDVGGERGWAPIPHKLALIDGKFAHTDECDHSTPPTPSLSMSAEDRS